MPKVYRGIDFANASANHSQCWLLDDGEQLTVALSEPPQPPDRTAVDCPFGTSSGFEQLLRGHLPLDTHADGFKTRATERYIRALVGQYRTIQDWQNRTERDLNAFYFHPSAHVQGTVGLVIVPGLLAWLGHESAATTAEDRLAFLRTARLGDGPIVEAHPRMFLYSVIERLAIYAHALPTAVLRAIVGYKHQTLGTEYRRTALERMSMNLAWQAANQRRGLVVPDVAALVGSDHVFDAWLAALTAWAHDSGQTLTWREARLSESIVETEGHMLILRTPPPQD